MSFFQDGIEWLVREGAAASVLAMTLSIIGLIGLIVMTLLLIFSR